MEHAGKEFPMRYRGFRKGMNIFMNQKLSDHNTEYLFRAILSLETVEDCQNFFEDLCTAAEIKAMCQRMHVARLLDEKVIYAEIVRQTGASTDTISRVNRSLLYGSDGYRKVLDNLKEEK